MALERGTLLNGRYRVVDILGQGGMGSVYRAVDENLGVDVALKENLFTTEEYARQFRREAVILATLRHPNLTRVTDHFVIEVQGQYLVMDYVEGEDLRQRMDRVGVLSEEEASLIGAAICDALTYLATRTPPIVHRDIKPGNIKITPAGEIFLVDFGLAKIIQSGQATTTGARAMTPGYSPPEQYGTARTDHRSDLFSLGATLYAALTGAIPEDALARAMDQVQLTPIRKHNPRVSRRIATVVEKSLSVRPDERYQSAEEFKQALLDARNLGRRKTGEYHIAPPPSGSGNAVPAGWGDTGSDSPPYVFPEDRINALPLPSSASTDLHSPYRPRLRWSSIVLVLLGFALVGGIGLYLYNPALPAQALTLLRSIPTATESALPVEGGAPTRTTAASLQPTETFTALVGLPAAIQTVIPAPSATASPSPLPPTPTATQTETPPTPTAIITPTGGGSGQIAFASDRTGTFQIYLMNVDGTGLRRLTDIDDGACQPDWSPDGRQLVFISPCENSQERYRNASLRILDLETEVIEQYFDRPGGDYDPSWSPDGDVIAFTSLRDGGRPRIYLLHLDTREVTLVSGIYGIDYQPAWHHSGDIMAFVTTQKGPVQIWTMDPEGQNQEIYTRSGDAINTYPDWSPDGEFIVFTQLNTRSSIPGLVVASYADDGTYAEFEYATEPIPAREAKYSTDGLWLAYESWPDGMNHDIYIMNAAGSEKTRLTNHPRLDIDPTWRPIVVP